MKFVIGIFATLVTIVALQSCCDLETFFKEGTLNGKELSVFQLYSGKYCEVSDSDNDRRIKINCEQVREFLNASDRGCQDSDFAPLLAHFPDRDRPANLCRKYDQPTRRSRDSIRFLVFGDTGAGQSSFSGYRQESVAQAMLSACPPRSSQGSDTFSCDFAIVVGDLIYPHGITQIWDPEMTQKFEAVYEGFGDFDFYVVPGNHDYHGNVTAQTEYTYFSNRWRMWGRHFAIPDLPPWFHIYGLDTTAMVDDDLHQHDNTAEQWTALRQKFCQGSGWRLLYGHHPAFSNGDHGDNTGMVKRLTSLHQECPFHVYLAGHDHHQEHISTNLFEMIVQGAGGAKIRAVDTTPSRVYKKGGTNATLTQKFARSDHGFGVVEATVDRIEIRFFGLSESGPSPSANDYIYRCLIERGSDHCEPAE